MTTPLPSSWTLEDIKFLIEQVEKYPVVLVNLPELGIPTVEYTLTVTGAEQVEAGIVQVHTPECVFLFDIRKKTPSGKTWDCVKMVSGAYPYDKATVLARLETFLPKCEPSAQPAITRSLPLGWEQADIRFLIEQIKKGTIVMVYDPALGIPSILDIPEEAITDCGNGESQVKTQGYEGKFSVERTPSGKAWMHLKVSAGFPHFSREKVLATLYSFTADNDQKPSPDPVPAELTREAVPAGPFELDPLELQILPPDDFFPPMPEEEPVFDNEPAVKKVATVPARAKTPKIIRLAYVDEENRIVARGDGLIAVCPCRGRGDKRTYGYWHMYYEDYLGVRHPGTHEQISAPNLCELAQKYNQAYGLQIEIDGAPGIPVEMPKLKESEVTA
jgi:hypothetical protein